MKEFKVVFADIDDALVADSFVVYVDGERQENVRSVGFSAHNDGGDVLRGLSDKVVWEAVGTYSLEHYIH